MALLETQEDFQNGKTLLEEKLAEWGARLVYLPKFHCEFNQSSVPTGESIIFMQTL